MTYELEIQIEELPSELKNAFDADERREIAAELELAEAEMIVAMAEQHGLAPVAPYFVDAEASTQPGPIGGLTVIRFPNNHRVYAITWFALALGVMLAAWLVVREQRKG